VLNLGCSVFWRRSKRPQAAIQPSKALPS